MTPGEQRERTARRRLTGFAWGVIAMVAAVTLLDLVFFHAHGFAAFVGASVVAGVIAYANRDGIARMLAPRPEPLGLLPTPIAKLLPGALVDTTGIVVSEKHEAPLGAPLCAFHRVRVTNERGDVVFESQSHDDLLLDDGSGTRLLVSLERAEWRLPEHHRDLASPDEDLLSYLRDRGIDASGELRAVVTWIAPRDVVFVRGHVREVEGGAPTGYRTSDAPELLRMTATVIGLEPLR